jgi:hypothetical protein
MIHIKQSGLQDNDVAAHQWLGGRLLELGLEAGDQTARIQAAIDGMAAEPIDAATGFRGVVKLAAGTWEVSDTLRLGVSGVVLAGQGPSTVVKAMESGFDAEQRYVLAVGGAGAAPARAAAEVAITSERVAVGEASFTAADGSSFNAGDDVVVEARWNAAAIAEIGMDAIPTCDDPASGCSSWDPAGYTIKFFRVVTAVDGDVITVDLPLTQAIRAAFGGGAIYHYACAGCVAMVGVRGMTFVSESSGGPRRGRWGHSAVPLPNPIGVLGAKDNGVRSNSPTALLQAGPRTRPTPGAP